jgi:hypothetical protein
MPLSSSHRPILFFERKGTKKRWQGPLNPFHTVTRMRGAARFDSEDKSFTWKCWGTARVFDRFLGPSFYTVQPVFLHGADRAPAGAAPRGGGGCGLLPSETDLLHYNQLSYLYVFMSPFPSFMSSASGEIDSSSDTHMADTTIRTKELIFWSLFYSPLSKHVVNV